MDKILKVGIVGMGGAGLAQYRHFSSIEGCAPTAVYDPEPQALERARQLSPKLFVTANFNEFLEGPIDVVSICAPDKTHADYILQSFKAGKHVLCEKPLTDSLQGCRAILQAEKQSKGCIAAVQHQMRFLPVHVRMKEIIGRGELGRVSYIEGYYVHNLTQRAKLYHPWRFTDNATPLVYSGCHFVDLLRWLLEDEVMEVFAMANNVAFPEYPESDLNVVLLRFKSGVIGKVITAFGAGRPQDHSVRVYGSEKSIENNLLFSKDGSFRVFCRPFIQKSSVNKSIKSVPTPENLRLILNNLKPIVLSRVWEGLMNLWTEPNHNYSINSYPLRLYEHSYAVHASINDFIDAIRHGKKPKCSLVDSAKTVATCLAGVESYRTSQVVPLTKYWIPEFHAE